jgi:hypothetical protein
MVDPTASPNPLGGVVRVASLAEQNAVLAAYPPPSGGWSVTSRLRLTLGPRVEEHVTLQGEGGETAAARFDVTAFASDEATPGPAAGALDRVMEAALATARESGPLHPGAMPRFPVPSMAC